MIKEQSPDSPSLLMPEIIDGQDILQLLMDVGISQQGAMSLAPISWTEIYSYRELTRSDISRWEAETIKTLSEVFCDKFHKFDDKDEPAPHVVETFDRAKVSATIGNRLRSMAKRRNQNVKAE